jgi:hypothetical protein
VLRTNMATLLGQRAPLATRAGPRCWPEVGMVGFFFWFFFLF